MKDLGFNGSNPEIAFKSNLIFPFGDFCVGFLLSIA
jgi:hypothetical protein